MIPRRTLTRFAFAGVLAVQVSGAQPPAPLEPTYRVAVDPLTVTLIGGMIVTVISAIVTGVVTIITAMRVGAVGAQGSKTADQLVAVAKDTEAIKGHVNSEKTAAQGREAALQQEVRMLREMVADKTNTASLLAQSVTGRASSRSTDQSPAVLPVEIVNQAPVPVVETTAAPTTERPT